MSRMVVLHFLRSRSQCHHRFFFNITHSSSVYHCFSSTTCGRPFTADPTFKTPFSLDTGRAGGVQSGEGDKETVVVYHGPNSSRIKQLKLLSLFVCCLSVSMVPAVNFLAPPDMNVILKGVLAWSTLFLGASITARFNRLVSPYIHKLPWVLGYDRIEVEMLSWLVIRTRMTIKFADIRPPETNRPLVTFKANGQFYFVLTEHFHNKALLARLTLQKGTHDSAFKNF